MHIPDRIRVTWDGVHEGVLNPDTGETITHVERIVLTMVHGSIEAAATYLIPMPGDPRGFQHIEVRYAGPTLELDLRAPLPKVSAALPEGAPEFALLPVDAPSDTPVLFVKADQEMWTLGRLDHIVQLIRAVREEALYEVMDYVVRRGLDTSVGRDTHDFIDALLKGEEVKP